MAFTRHRRRFPFRRRQRGRRPETYTLMTCLDEVNVWQRAECNEENSLIEAIELFGPLPAVGVSSQKSPATIGTKGFSVKGIKFQSEHWFDPNDAFSFGQGSCSVANPTARTLILQVYESIVVLPLSGASEIGPAYLPNVATQRFDDADRVLWKRISLITWLPLGLGQGGLFPQNQIATAGGAQVVKSKVFLDDRHALFFVRQFIHPFNIVEPLTCYLNVKHTNWFKIYYNEVR